MTKTVAAFILAGGRGKRMDLLCHLRPKPALPFAGRFRVIDFTLSNCVHSQVNSVAALVDYQRADMTQYLTSWHLANSRASGLSVLEPKIGSYAGTADAVYQNLNYVDRLGADKVLILAGDQVYKMDYRNILAFHDKAEADVTVGVIRVPIEQASRFGTLATDSDGRITQFVEKSSRPESNLASMGIYVFNKDILTERLLDDARETRSPHDFGYAILPRMVKRDRVFAYEFSGYWQDIGTVEAYYETNMELLGMRPRFSLDSNWPILTENETPFAQMPGQGSIVKSLVSPGCLIKGHVQNSILSPGVVVEDKAEVRDSVIMSNVTIGYHSVVDRCILDEGVQIGKCCYIGFGDRPLQRDWDITVLGKQVTVPSGTAIGRKCRVLPRVGIDEFSTSLVQSGSVVRSRG